MDMYVGCIACTVYVRKTVTREVCSHLCLQMGVFTGFVHVTVLVRVCHRRVLRQMLKSISTQSQGLRRRQHKCNEYTLSNYLHVFRVQIDAGVSSIRCKESKRKRKKN